LTTPSSAEVKNMWSYTSFYNVFVAGTRKILAFLTLVVYQYYCCSKINYGRSRLGRCTPGKETRYPTYRRLGGPQGRSGRVPKISPPLEFNPRTIQLVASCYTDFAVLTPPDLHCWNLFFPSDLLFI